SASALSVSLNSTADIPTRQIADQPPSNPARAQGRPTMSHTDQSVVIALVGFDKMTYPWPPIGTWSAPHPGGPE
ncbi:MAG: hypothetical protein ACRDNS_16645, partial [Trebonia sp.]